MNNFISILEKEIASIIEGLTGFTPNLTLEKEELISETEIKSPLAEVSINSKGDINASLKVALAPTIATALGDLMLAGEGEEKDDMNDDDVDALKEIISNIFGSLSTTLSAQKDLPKLTFEVTDAKFIPKDEEIALLDFYRVYIYEFNIANSNAHMLLVFDENFISYFEDSNSKEPISEDISTATTTNPTENIDPNELKNISLIMDVQLPIRVRIGTKVMLLKDVLNLDIGSVIELEQLANDPLDILIGDKVIAKGEVVIVDGNFGVQVLEIGTKRERLEQLK